MKHNCYSRDTEVLTENGFIPFHELKEDVKVAQVHNDGNLDFTFPIEIINTFYNGDMYEFSDVNLLVTPDHRVAWRKYNDPQYYTTAAQEFTPNAHSVFDFGAKASGTVHFISLIDSLKIVYTVGSIHKKDSRYVALFSEDSKLECFCLLLNSMYIQHDVTERSDNTWVVDFSIDSNLETDFSEYNLSDKSDAWAQDFLSELSFWSTNYDNEDHDEDSFCLTKQNPKVTRFVQAVAAMAGFFSYETLGALKDEKDIYVSFSDNGYINTEEINKTTVLYNDDVYCVTVPSGNIVVRRNGVTLVCGNSRPKTQTS